VEQHVKQPKMLQDYTALENKNANYAKKNHEPEPPVDDLTDAEDLG
jgi:uncharacterized membrane protein